MGKRVVVGCEITCQFKTSALHPCTDVGVPRQLSNADIKPSFLPTRNAPHLHLCVLGLPQRHCGGLRQLVPQHNLAKLREKLLGNFIGIKEIVRS